MTFEGQQYSLSGTAAISKIISSLTTERAPLALDEENKVMAALSMTTDPFALEAGLYMNDSPSPQSGESTEDKEDGLPSVLYAMNANYRTSSRIEQLNSSVSSPEVASSPKTANLFSVPSSPGLINNKMPIQSLVSNTNHTSPMSSFISSSTQPTSPQSALQQMSPFVQVVTPDENVNESSVLDFFNAPNNTSGYDDTSLPLTPNGSVNQWFRQ